MNVLDDYEDWIASIPEDRDFNLKMDFAVEIEKAMEEGGITKREMAAKLGVSPARVTKILSGEANLTIETMNRIAEVLDCTLHLHLAQNDVNVRWFDFTKKAKDNLVDAWRFINEVKHEKISVAA